ncbi:hypothetical protein D3C87_1872590 [compost metagenome]
MGQHLPARDGILARLGVERAAGAEELDAEPDEIGRADPFQRGEDHGRGGEQRAHAEHGERHRREVPERDADRGREGGAPALAERIGDDEQDGRAGDHQQHGGRGGEGGPSFEGHGDGSR